MDINYTSHSMIELDWLMTHQTDNPVHAYAASDTGRLKARRRAGA